MPSINPLFEEILMSLVEEAMSVVKGHYAEQKKQKSIEKALGNAIGMILDARKNDQYYNDLIRILNNSRIISDMVNRWVVGEKSLDIDLRAEELANKNGCTYELASFLRSFLHEFDKSLENIFVSSMDPSGRVLRHCVLDETNEVKESISLLNKNFGELKAKLSKSNEVAAIKVSTLDGQNKPDLYGRIIMKRSIIAVDKCNDPEVSPNAEALSTVIEDKHVILSGDAGSGKTYTVFQLYDEAQSAGLHVIYYSLPYMSDANALEILVQENVEVDKDTIILLDGYDELPEKKKNKIIALLASVNRLYPCILVVISSRGNAIDDKISSLGYRRCIISSLDRNTIIDYLEQLGIDSNGFIMQIQENGLTDIYNIPFYLEEMVHMWNYDGKLPSKSMLMNNIVKTRIRTDSDRFSRTQLNLQRVILDQTQVLERIALILQCTQRQYLTISELSRIVDPKKSILEHYGLWLRGAEEGWRFSHSIFREYFAARALARFDLQGILAYIANPYDKSTVRVSWYNVLAFLLSECQLDSISKFDNLLNWLMENDVKALLFCEKDKISDDVRTAAFCHLLEECKAENTWIDHNLFFDNHFAAFTCNSKTITYILQELELPISERQKQNLLRCLASFNSLCKLDEKVVKLIRSIIFDLSANECLRADAINVMCEHAGAFKNMAYTMVEIFRSEKNVHLKRRIIQFWQQLDSIDEYIEIILREFEEHGRTTDDHFLYRHFLISVLKSIKHVHSAEQLLKCLNANRGNLYDMKDIKVIPLCSAIGIESFRNGQRDSILGLLLEVLAFPFGLCDDDFASIKQYVVETHSEKTMLDGILAMHRTNQAAAILGKILCDSLIDEIEKMLKSGNIAIQILTELSQNYDVEIGYRRRIAQVCFIYDGTKLEVSSYLSVSAKKAIAQQTYFDALFDKEKYSILVSQIVAIMGEKTTVGMEIDPENYSSFSMMQNEPALSRCWFDLQAYFSESEDVLFSDSINRITDWNAYKLHFANRVLENKQFEIAISDIQHNEIEKYVFEKLDSIEVDHFVVNGHSISYPRFVPDCLRAMRLFKLKCSKELAEKLLSVPLLLFDDREYYDNYPDWVLNALDENDVSRIITQRINEKRLNVFLAPAYIRYCIDNNVTGCKNSLIEYILDPEYNCGDYSYGIEYIAKVFGEKVLLDEVVPYCSDMKMLLNVVSYIPEHVPSDYLDDKLWSMYCDSKDLECLKRLIERNYLAAVEEYYQLAVESMALPDDVPEPAVPILLDSISAVSSPRCTDTMIKLLLLAYDKDFKDREDFGLKHFSFSALRKIAVNNADTVIAKLEQVKGQEAEINEVISYLLQTIKADQIRLSDVPWTFEEALTLVPEH